MFVGKNNLDLAKSRILIIIIFLVQVKELTKQILYTPGQSKVKERKGSNVF